MDNRSCSGISKIARRRGKPMMKSLSRLHRPVRFESLRWVDSETMAGVRFAVRRPSLAQRIELTRRVHELTLRHEFLKAGSEAEKLEGALGELMVQQLYIERSEEHTSELQSPVHLV